MPELLADERFATNELRLKNYDIVTPLIQAKIKTMTKAELTEAFNAYKIPNAPVNTIPELMHHPQLEARGMLIDLVDDEIGAYKAMGNPMMMDLTPAVIEKGAPSMGRDTDAVLKEFGYSEEEIKSLYDNEII